jgi:hypothetical protein
MTVEEFQGLVATVGFSAAEAALKAAGGFSTSTNPWDYGEFGEGSSEYAIPSVAPTSINYPEFGVGSSEYATNSFLNKLNALATSTPTSTPTPTPTPDDQVAESPTSQSVIDALAQPRIDDSTLPWDNFPVNSDREILGKMNQGFYTLNSPGHYASLRRFYEDAAAYLAAQGVEANDQNVYATMQHLAEQAAKQTGGTVADQYFWYDRNITDWIDKGRPLKPGGPAQAAVYGDAIGILKSLNEGTVIRTSDLDKITDPATKASAVTLLTNNILRTLGNTADGTSALGEIFNKYIDIEGGDPAVRSGGFGTWARALGFDFSNVPPADVKGLSQAEIIDLFEADSSVARADYDPTAAGGAATTDVPANLQAAFGTDATSSNNAANESYNDWLAKGAPGREELETILIDPSTVSGTGTGLPSLGAGGVLPDPTVTPFTGGVSGAEVGGPASMDIFGQMQTQENFPADVFRRFLAEQASPSGEYQALSPFMMRGAQDLAPQLMSEYSASIYDPSNWTDAGNQSTFGDWLRAGERPTRQGMFNTLQNIGNVVSAGQQGLTAPGLSLGESLRRQNIINQFGTETEGSRKALQGLFSTAALKGVAPAFRYPVQSAAQNLFQTQRALQPEQSFLSFLGERL